MDGMSDWKARQLVFKTNAQVTGHKFKDDLAEVDITWKPDTIVEDALAHFKGYVKEWIYPAKSYFVAICYAHWIAEDFYQDFYEVLDDEDLLPNDPHFEPYSNDKEIYDEILSKCSLSVMVGMMPDVYEYYREELLIDQYPINPDTKS